MTPPKLAHANLPPSQRHLVDAAKHLYQERLAYFAQTHTAPAYICAAPGRVNLIGEHVDYQAGFVLPLCLDPAVHATVCYGTGFLTLSKSSAATAVRLRLVSDQAFPDGEDDNGHNDDDDGVVMIEERRLSANSIVAPSKNSSSNSKNNKSHWVNYVVGVIVQYLPDLPATGGVLDLAMAYVSSVPLSAGLSSSASLEVVTATFLECFLHDAMAYSSVRVPAATLSPPTSSSSTITTAEGSGDTTATTRSTHEQNQVTRAVRCQTAENEWAHSPCGIMDQMVVSCGVANHLLLLDCRTLTYTMVPLKQDTSTTATTTATPTPVFLIANSNVKHDIANENEYGARRKECSDAVTALQSVPLYHVEALRDATLADVTLGYEKGKLDETLYRRAKHVVSENNRTKECCTALRLGLWDKVGVLMNASHASLRDDFQVSCPPVDSLVAIAQDLPGVYGSRMTGGGFGGCTVTLVEASRATDVMEAMQRLYFEQTGLHCDCFVTTQPGDGAKVIAIDMDCKPESDFYKAKK